MEYTFSMKIHFPLIVGNWKMHKTVEETRHFIRSIKTLKFTKSSVWLAVPFTSLLAASQSTQGTSFEIGAQNMSDLMAGALTGEISSLMIKEAGASFVILGHSERRKMFHETDAMINRKVKLALRSGLKVILCIGETAKERESGETEEVLTKQLKLGLKDVPSEMASRIVLAYEPVWAIGSKNPATVEIVEEIHTLCKNYVANYWDRPLDSCHVLYGGSVNGGNAEQFLKLPMVDGLLVGAASLDVQSFTEIIHQAEGVR